jgi:(p)ppGpp synthase/HD superfamily hydrolase
MHLASPCWSQDLFKRALDFAARAHGDQKVPGSGFPYVVHVTKVASEVLLASVLDPTPDVDTDLAMVCALLHDTLEDTDVVPEALATEFGPAVAAGVQALTKDARLPKAEQMAGSLLRIRQQPRAVWRVKLADRITNLERPPDRWSLEKRQAYRADAQVILVSLRGASSWLEQRIAQKIEEYEAFCRPHEAP